MGQEDWRQVVLDYINARNAYEGSDTSETGRRYAYQYHSAREALQRLVNEPVEGGAHASS